MLFDAQYKSIICLMLCNVSPKPSMHRTSKLLPRTTGMDCSYQHYRTVHMCNSLTMQDITSSGSKWNSSCSYLSYLSHKELCMWCLLIHIIVFLKCRTDSWKEPTSKFIPISLVRHTWVWILLSPLNQRICPRRSSRSAWSISSTSSFSSSSGTSVFSVSPPASFKNFSLLVGMVAITWKK